MEQAILLLATALLLAMPFVAGCEPKPEDAGVCDRGFNDGCDDRRNASNDEPLDFEDTGVYDIYESCYLEGWNACG